MMSALEKRRNTLEKNGLSRNSSLFSSISSTISISINMTSLLRSSLSAVPSSGSSSSPTLCVRSNFLYPSYFSPFYRSFDRPSELSICFSVNSLEQRYASSGRKTHKYSKQALKFPIANPIKLKDKRAVPVLLLQDTPGKGKKGQSIVSHPSEAAKEAYEFCEKGRTSFNLRTCPDFPFPLSRAPFR